MLQPLIESGTKEDHNFKPPTSETVEHDFVTVPLIAHVVELLSDVLNSDVMLERRGISLCTLQCSNLRHEGLDKMANCHSRRDSVRIDNHIGSDTFSGEWKIFLSIGHTTSSLLTMTRSELISNLWNLNLLVKK